MATGIKIKYEQGTQGPHRVVTGELVVETDIAVTISREGMIARLVIPWSRIIELETWPL